MSITGNQIRMHSTNTSQAQSDRIDCQRRDIRLNFRSEEASLLHRSWSANLLLARTEGQG